MMPTDIKSKPGLKKFFAKRSPEIQSYFEHLPALLDEFPMDVCLAYVFARLELGQNMALYCGAVKVHKAQSEVARNAVGTHHMTREEFVELFTTVFDCALPAEAHKDLRRAEEVRDMVMHGKEATDNQVRNAIARAIEYAEALNAQLHAKHRLKPYGNLKGFAGKSRKLDKRTTRFLLKGLGFGIA